MRVLVACEFSGTVREAFRRRGHEAWSCDLLPAEPASPYHVQGDALAMLGDGWDLLVAHPPCTRLANSGVRWLAERNLWADLDAACVFFRAFWDAPVPRICIENPLQHRHARERIGVPYHQVIQPWEFGHGETKATCLWLKNLPPLMSTIHDQGREARIHKMPPSADRGKLRSVFFTGVADAMADQWGGDLRAVA